MYKPGDIIRPNKNCPESDSWVGLSIVIEIEDLGMLTIFSLKESIETNIRQRDVELVKEASLVCKCGNLKYYKSMYCEDCL